MHRGVGVVTRADRARPPVRGTPTTEGDPSVGRALGVDDHLSGIREGFTTGPSDLSPRRLVEGLGGDHVRIQRGDVASVTADVRRESLRAQQDPFTVDVDPAPGDRDHGAVASGAWSDREKPRVAPDGDACRFDHAHEPDEQCQRVHRGTRGTPRRPEHRRNLHPGRDFVGSEHAKERLVESVAASFGDARPHPAELRCVACQREGAGLCPSAVDAVRSDELTDLGHRVDECLLEGAGVPGGRRGCDLVQ